MKAYIGTLVALLALFSIASAADNITCWTCQEEDIAMCNSTQVEMCDGECYKRSLDVNDKINQFDRGCTSTCVGANVLGQGSFCCEEDLCNTAATTSPFLAFSMFVSVLLLLANKL